MRGVKTLGQLIVLTAVILALGACPEEQPQPTCLAPLGAACRVGEEISFGVGGKISPSGLAAIGDTLYMVTSSMDHSTTDTLDAALYTVDTTTGAATRVDTTGTVVQLGVSERLPAGLASINGTLYMLGGATSALYTIDITTGEATRVDTTGNVMNFGTLEIFPTALAAIGDTLYMTGRATVLLYTLDKTTGTATPVGNTRGFQEQEFAPRGLASINGTLYMAGGWVDALVYPQCIHRHGNPRGSYRESGEFWGSGNRPPRPRCHRQHTVYGGQFHRCPVYPPVQIDTHTSSRRVKEYLFTFVNFVGQQRHSLVDTVTLLLLFPAAPAATAAVAFA